MITKPVSRSLRTFRTPGRRTCRQPPRRGSHHSPGIEKTGNMGCRHAVCENKTGLQIPVRPIGDPWICEEVLTVEKKGEEYATSYLARIVERFIHTRRVKDCSRRCDRKVCFRAICGIANPYRSALLADPTRPSGDDPAAVNRWMRS